MTYIFIHLALPEASPSKVNFLAELVQYYQSAAKCDDGANSSMEDGSSSEVYIYTYGFEIPFTIL